MHAASGAGTRAAQLAGDSAASGGGFDFPDEEEDAPTLGRRHSRAGSGPRPGHRVPRARVRQLLPQERAAQVRHARSRAVVYLGFWKSLLISIVNVFGLLGGNLPIFRYSLAWYLLAAITLVSTVLWGRVYCGRICAFGALTQLMDAVLPAKWRGTCRARSSGARR